MGQQRAAAISKVFWMPRSGKPQQPDQGLLFNHCFFKLGFLMNPELPSGARCNLRSFVAIPHGCRAIQSKS